MKRIKFTNSEHELKFIKNIWIQDHSKHVSDSIPEKKNEIALLIPGINTFPNTNYSKLLSSLAEKYKSVFALEYPGISNTNKINLKQSQIKIDHYIELLNFVHKQLQENCKTKEVNLFAHSFGGYLTTKYLSQNSVKSVTLMNPMTKPKSTSIIKFLLNQIIENYRLIINKDIHFDDGAFIEYLNLFNLPGIIQLSFFVKKIPDLKIKDISEIKLPNSFKLILGKKDLIIDSAYSNEIFQVIKNDISIIHYDNHGHNIPLFKL